MALAPARDPATRSAARQRFVAPAPTAVASDVFARPPLLDWVAAWPHLLPRPHWPGIIALEEARRAAEAFDDVTRPCFVNQDPALLGDGLHYEQRIAAGRLATRLGNWHDLFNAMAWLRFPRIKHALNAGQCDGIARAGPAQRTRAQCALTHFDEAGVIVVCADDVMLERWNAHDWPALFRAHAGDWGRSIVAVVFGHALLEHALDPSRFLVGKAIALKATAADVEALAGADRLALQALDEGVARRLLATDLLDDPQNLRPLPLSGIPGWHEGNQDAAFYASAPCFRPLREGRRYPPASLI